MLVNLYTMAKVSKNESSKAKPALKQPKGYEIASNEDELSRSVNEPVVPYLSSPPRFRSIIGGASSRPEWQMTAVEKMDLVKEGVNKKKLESLKSKMNLDYDKLSTMLSTTRATLINKKGTEVFSASLSERIVSVAEVYSYGFEVFESEAAFNEWVMRPNRALGGKPPFDLLDNQFGRDEVKNLLGRIEYGVYS